MAVIDVERDAVVVRIVYDGPPFAGKTTSVRSLARSLGRTSETPAEVDGRTTYFDWLEYTGGLFEGRKIHCQIFSVPGQPELDARRRALLALADAVVFVLDTSNAATVALSEAYVRQLTELLRQRTGAPVGVIVQANKRDLPGALSREEVQQVLGQDFARVALTESDASAGIGIRETFVFAVRLAIDRVRVEMEQAELALSKPAIDSAGQLLQALESVPLEFGAPPASAGRAGTAPRESVTSPIVSKEPAVAPPASMEASASPVALADEARTAMVSAVEPPRSAAWQRGRSSTLPLVPPLPRAALARSHGLAWSRPEGASPPSASPAATELAPLVPTVTVVSGAIWPPVEGRMILHEAGALGLVAHRLGRGEWAAGIGSDWRVHSGSSDEYASFEDGRRALISWAREHALLSPLLSSQRCIVLADTGIGTWRLWQVVRVAPALRGWLSESAQEHVAVLYRRLVEAASILGDALGRCGTTRLRPTFDNFGRGVGRYGGWYVGLMPGLAALAAPPPAEMEPEISIRLGEILSAELSSRCGELEHQVVGLWTGTSPWDAVVTSAILRAVRKSS